MNTELYKLKGSLLDNHSLTAYTSWKIGGPAEYFYCPLDTQDLAQILQIWPKEPITILGAATNVLISDDGITGLVIYLRNNLNQLQEIGDNNLRVEAGVGLMHLVQKCADLGMMDATFMTGIPGTIGGALRMNAGAYGKFIWDHVKAVETINRQGKIRLRNANEFIPGYRQIEGLDKNEWFVAANLAFTRGDVEATKQQVKTILQKREKSQPLDLPSCGSVFRNPPGNYAAKLIESSNLKGKQIGGAKVSEKHANFIVNCGNATAADIKALMQEIMLAVEKTSGIKLVPEVHMLGKI